MAKWKQKFDWVLVDNVWTQVDRHEQFNEGRFISVDDIYFKNSKYLSGVTYTYINKLEDIYKRDLLTGDGYSIYNMYNEYNIISEMYMNNVIVDVASNTDIDINKQWYKINNVQLKPGQLVLLRIQDSEHQNDVYKVGKQYFLENANLLSDRNKSYRFSVTVKMGTYNDCQFFLVNNGMEFPITDEPKHFVEGDSFVLKSLIEYNLYNTSTLSADTSKIVFTDYETARRQLPTNSSLYQDIIVIMSDTSSPISNYFEVSYHHDSYSIKNVNSVNEKQYSGSAGGVVNTDRGTEVTTFSPFVASVGDYIDLEFFDSSGNTRLKMKNYVDDFSGGVVLLKEMIPNRVITDLNGDDFIIINYSLATDTADAIDVLENNSPYSQFIEVQSSLSLSLYTVVIKTASFDYDKYFDYSDLYIRIFSTSYEFLSLNQYIDYTLLSRLNMINPSVFVGSFKFFNTFSTTNISYRYTDYSRIKITFANSGDTSNFREYTYVYLNNEPLSRVMVWRIDSDSIYVDKPPSYIGLNDGVPTNVYKVSNIDGLENISNILQNVYINIDYDWYISKKSNIRKKISHAYGELLSYSEDVQKYVTGLLYDNGKGEFLLKLYDFESDTNLSYSPVSIMNLGSDRKTRIPVPVENLEVSDNSLYNWDVIDGGLNGVMVDSDIFDFGYNEVLGGPNNPPILYTTIDGT